MTDLAKYQYSVFLGRNRDEQLVIRTDDFKEFVEMGKEIQPIIDKKQKELAEKQALRSSVAPPMDNLTSTCPIHGVPMQQKNGQYGTYWSHMTTDGYCNGKKITPRKSY